MWMRFVAVNDSFPRHVTDVLVICAAALLMTACAPSVDTRAPSGLLRPAPQGGPATIELTRDTVIQLSTGYARTLSAGSKWQLVGELAEGSVYKPVDGVLTVEGSSVHEAYLLLSANMLVGFYLPVENAIFPLSPATALPVSQ